MQEHYRRKIMVRFLTKEELDRFDSMYTMFKSPTLSNYVEGGNITVEIKTKKYDF